MGDGYGIDKSSVSRPWKAASRPQLKQMLERPLGNLDLCVLFLDGKEFHDCTLMAAESLEEGLEETLTINRLGLPPPLRRRFASTNLIESCFSRAGDLCRGVKRWRDGNRARRWAGTVLLEAETRFHRIQGQGQWPLLINALSKTLDKQEAAA